MAESPVNESISTNTETAFTTSDDEDVDQVRQILDIATPSKCND